MSNTMHARDIYMRHTDKSGQSYVQEHRVWDAEKFVLSQQAAATKEGGSAQQVTREAYLLKSERKPK